jgi:hypothetical protein
MFFVSFHSSGGLAVRDTPVAYGPRHCGQKRSALLAERVSGCAATTDATSAHDKKETRSKNMMWRSPSGLRTQG